MRTIMRNKTGVRLKVFAKLTILIHSRNILPVFFVNESQNDSKTVYHTPNRFPVITFHANRRYLSSF